MQDISVGADRPRLQKGLVDAWSGVGHDRIYNVVNQLLGPSQWRISLSSDVSEK
jgi:hypothetical protein